MEILLILEIIGTVAFAISGAIVGIQKKMDIFGVSILGLTAAVGGGILRDLILNITPPAAFVNPIFAITAVIVSIIVWIVAMFTVFPSEHECLPIFAIIEGEPVAVVRIEAKDTTDIFPIPIQIQSTTVISVIEPGPRASFDIAVL